MLDIDGGEQHERRAEDGSEQGLAAEAEGSEARGDEGKRRNHDEDAQIPGREELGERPRLDHGRLGLGRRLWRRGGVRHGDSRHAHQLLSAWKMETTAGPRMTTNR